MWFSAQVEPSKKPTQPTPDSPPVGIPPTPEPLGPIPETNCLVRATSPTPGGLFNLDKYYCGFDFTSTSLQLPSDATVGMLDPSVFVDPQTGQIILSWSRQKDPYGPGNSEIVSLELTPDGSMPALVAPNTTITTTITYNQVQDGLGQIVPGSDNDPGIITRVIENPQFVASPGSASPYAFFLSYGTWSESGRYHTVRMSSTSTLGAQPSSPVVIDAGLKGGGNPQDITNPGSLSNEP